jgi:hypothetical protein
MYSRDIRELLKNSGVPRHKAGIVPDNLLHFLHPWRSDMPPFSMADKPLKMHESKIAPRLSFRGFILGLINPGRTYSDLP